MLPKAVRKIKEYRKKHPFDAIAFTGTSGSAIAYPLSYMLKLPLICVRKKNDGNHFYRDIEGCTNARSYLIVDDFIESGRTMDKIISAVKGTTPSAKPVGIFLYSDASYARREHWKKIPIFRMMRDE
jgi:adenine/guanine phosphoribosyltransferase-like PRPP-binding protein